MAPHIIAAKLNRESLLNIVFRSSLMSLATVYKCIKLTREWGEARDCLIKK